MLSALLLATAAGASVQQSRVEVPFRIGEDAIIVDALVNNKKLSFMFDTGFSGTLVVDQSINLGPKAGSIMLRDFVRQFEAPLVNIKTLKIGEQVIDSAEMQAVMQPNAGSSFSYNTHVDGIMGYEVIANYITEINFKSSKFVFYPDSYDISKRTPDNKTTFLGKMLPIGNNSIEMEVEVGNGKKMHLALDTGNAFYATTHRDVLERVGVWPEGRKPGYVKQSFVASGAVDSWDIKMTNLKIFGVPVETSYWNIIDLPASSAEGDGTVGFGFLKNFNITIDQKRRRVWLEKISEQVGNKPDGNPGITAAYDSDIKRVRIFRISPGSPAEQAGIKAGDHLLSVDGKNFAGPMSFRQIAALLNGEQGSKVALSISKGGNLVRYELDRAYLVNEVD